MGDRIFFPQDVLDAWTADERVELKDNTILVKEYDQTFALMPAVHFLADVGDGKDLYDLVGRVKDKDQLASMNAEHYMDSVILCDSAYQVRQGYLGSDLSAAEEATPPGPAESLSNSSIRSAVSKTVEAKPEDDSDEKDMLTKFLLEKL